MFAKILLLLLLPYYCFAQAPDVRAVRWGMTKEQVVRAENGGALISQSVNTLKYNEVEIGRFIAEIIYKFHNDNLVSVDYHLINQEGPLYCVEDYEVINKLITSKYGKTTDDRTTGKAPAPENAMTTIMKGLYSRSTFWTLPRTSISHFLQPSISSISHSLHFNASNPAPFKPERLEDF